MSRNIETSKNIEVKSLFAAMNLLLEIDARLLINEGSVADVSERAGDIVKRNWLMMMLAHQKILLFAGFFLSNFEFQPR